MLKATSDQKKNEQPELIKQFSEEKRLEENWKDLQAEMKNSKQKIQLKITCVNETVLSITQNYPSTLLFSKHY